MSDALAKPTPSKRAKSTSARDLRYGRQGGGWLPLMTDFEQAEAFKAAMAAGQVVYSSRFCTFWWIVARDVGTICGHCGFPMERTA